MVLKLSFRTSSTLSTSMCSEIAAPAVGPNLEYLHNRDGEIEIMAYPGTTLTTPGGKPASFTSWATARPLWDIFLVRAIFFKIFT